MILSPLSKFMPEKATMAVVKNSCHVDDADDQPAATSRKKWEKH